MNQLQRLCCKEWDERMIMHWESEGMRERSSHELFGSSILVSAWKDQGIPQKASVRCLSAELTWMSGTGNKTMKKHVLMKQSSSLAQKNY